MSERKGRVLYLEEFCCGCTNVDYRRDLLGYCGKHGENRRRAPYRLGRAKDHPELTKGLA